MPPCKNDHRRRFTGDEPSPKGFGFCAHAENIGTIKRGQDGMLWIVKKYNVHRWVKIGVKPPKRKVPAKATANKSPKNTSLKSAKKALKRNSPKKTLKKTPKKTPKKTHTKAYRNYYRGKSPEQKA